MFEGHTPDLECEKAMNSFHPKAHMHIYIMQKLHTISEVQGCTSQSLDSKYTWWNYLAYMYLLISFVYI